MLGTQEICDRITSGLAALARRNRSQVAAVLDDLGLPRKTIHEVVHRTHRVHLERILDLVGAFGENRLRFLARRLEILVEPEDFLCWIEGDKPHNVRAVHRLKQATEEMLACMPSKPCPGSGLDLRSPESTSPTVERKIAAFRRLRFSDGMAALYRDPGLSDPEVAWGLLAYWQDLRFRKPAGASRMTVAAALGLIPRVNCGTYERIALFCEALGVYAVVERQRENRQAAAFALNRSLEIARNCDLIRIRNRQLHRGAVLMTATGRHEASIRTLKDVIAFHEIQGESARIGRALASYALARTYQGKCSEAEAAFHRSLQLLPPDNPRHRRWRVMAWNALSYLEGESGNICDANQLLSRAIREHGDQQDVFAGDLRLQASKLASLHDNPNRAESLAEDARRIYSALSSPKAAVALLNLVRLLLRRGALSEAKDLARTAASHLKLLRRHPVGPSVLMDLQQMSDRNLTENAVRSLERRLTGLAVGPRDRLAGTG